MWLPFLPEIGDWGRSEERDGLGHEPARRERYEWHLPILPESAIRLPILPEIRGGHLWICLRMGERGSEGHCRFCRDSNFCLVRAEVGCRFCRNTRLNTEATKENGGRERHCRFCR